MMLYFKSTNLKKQSQTTPAWEKHEVTKYPVKLLTKLLQVLTSYNSNSPASI